MKNKFLIVLIALIFLIAIAILGSSLYENNQLKQNTIDKRISRYIEDNCPDLKICYAANNCPEEEKCKVNISNFTDFNWDTFCTVDSGATLTDNPSIIPAPLPEKYSFNNPKFIFLLKNNIVLFEEIPVGIENIPSGTVTVDTRKYCFEKKETIFNVKKIDNGLKGIYNLFQEDENAQ